MDDALAGTLRARLAAVFCGPWASREGITDWSGLSLGRAEADGDAAMTDEPPPLPISQGASQGASMNPSPAQSPQCPPAPGVPGLPPLSPAGGSVPGHSLPGQLPGAGVVMDLTPEELSTLQQLQGQFSNLRVRRLIDEGASSKVWEGDWAGARVVIKVRRAEEPLPTRPSMALPQRPSIALPLTCLGLPLPSADLFHDLH